MTPMPPSWARAMARRASVTVSMAALMSGMFSLIFRVRDVLVSASRGSTDEAAGTRSTSLKVSPSRTSFGFIFVIATLQFVGPFPS